MPVRLSSRLLLGLAVVSTAALAASASLAWRPEESLQDVPIATTVFKPEDLNNAGLAIDVLTTINAVRTNPRAFADEVRNRPINLRGLSGPDRSEALAFLENQAPVAPLTYSPALSDIAAVHARDIGLAGLTSHTGSNGSTMGGRARDRGIIASLTAEEMSFGQTSGVTVTWQFIADPGILGRPHRKDIFNPFFVFAGVSCAIHQGFKKVCVVNLSGPMMTRPPATSLPPMTPGYRFTCPAGRTPVELDDWRTKVFGQIRVPYDSPANRPWRDELSSANVAATLGYATPNRLDLSFEPRLTLPRSLGMGYGYCADDGLAQDASLMDDNHERPPPTDPNHPIPNPEPGRRTPDVPLSPPPNAPF